MRADELQDYLEVRDPKVREHIRKSNEARQAGKGRPIEEFLAELLTKAPRRNSATAKCT